MLRDSRPRGLVQGLRHQPQGRLPRHARGGAADAQARRRHGHHHRLGRGATTRSRAGATTAPRRPPALMMTKALHKEEAARRDPRAVAVARHGRHRHAARDQGLAASTRSRRWPGKITSRSEWPAQALLWMCSPEADEFLGDEVALGDPEVRARVGRRRVIRLARDGGLWTRHHRPARQGQFADRRDARNPGRFCRRGGARGARAGADRRRQGVLRRGRSRRGPRRARHQPALGAALGRHRRAPRS